MSDMKLVGLQLEVSRLKRISERQSKMLAQALKEKNDLVNIATDKGYERSRYYEKQVAELQLQLSGALEELRELKKLARNFMKGLGVL